MFPKEKAFAYVDAHFDEMLEDLKRACACPGVASDPRGLEAMRQRLAEDMEACGLSPVLHPVEDGNALVTAELSGNSPETLLFYNHYDVVEPGDAEKWTNRDPFTACVRNGRLYARGISDDKGGLYFRLHAVRAMLAAGGCLPMSVKFLVEGDEESASPSMTRFAKEHPDEFRELTRADVCLWENGRVDDQGRPWLRCGVRASASFDLRVRTAVSDVHSRMGATVPSASWRLVWALATLKDPATERVLIEGFYDDILPTTEADLQVLRDFPFDEEAMRRSLGLKQFVLGATGEQLKLQMYTEPTLSICGLEAGEMYKGVRGIVPAAASARINCYLVADQNPADIGRRLREHLDRNGFDDVEVISCGGCSRPVRTNPDHPFRWRACRCAGEVYAQPMVVELTQMGAGPADVLRQAWPSLPIFGIGPASVSGNHHAPDENIVIEDYRNAIKYLIALCCSCQ